jgi:stage II sporulation protein GA (sporulation sigma-E factor processing peptidase)
MHLDVYGEALFIENFMVGYGIIRLTGIMCGRKPSKPRVAAGAVFCGLFAFILFINIPRTVEMISGILFAVAVVYIVFDPAGLKSTFRLAAVFYMVSFLTGGTVIAVIYASGCRGVVSNGIFYIGRRVYIFMAAGITTAVIMGGSMVKFLRKSAIRSDETVWISIDVMGKKINCRGKIDTANYLKEPLSGKPVSIIEKEVAELAWGELLKNHMLDNRLRVIPYTSLGCSGGNIMALRCDNMVIEREKGRIYLRNVYVGLYEGSFLGDESEESYSVLLQPELINERCCTK